MKIPERDVVPTLLLPEDPSAQDEALLPPLASKAARLFLSRIHPCLSGKLPWDPELPALARQLQLDQPPLPLPPPPQLERDLSDSLLADLCEDYNPDAGVMGERITGDAWLPLDSRTAAALFFVPTLWRGVRGVECWAKEAKDSALRRSVQALDRAPPWLWVGQSALAWGAEARRPLWVGRLYQSPDGFRRSAAWDLPDGLPLHNVYRRIQGELWRFRLWHPGASLAELLRLRPELIYRACLELARRMDAAAHGHDKKE